MQFSTEYFILLVVLTLGLRLYLAYRQIKAISLGLTKVPTQFSSAITLQEHTKAGYYNIDKLKLSIVDHIIASVILIGFTLGGGLNLLTSLGDKLGLKGLTSSVFILFSYIIINSVISLIISYIGTFKIEHKYGFNKMTKGLFFLDTFKSLVLFILIGIPLFYLILWLINYFNQSWWLYVWLVIITFNLLILIIYPSIIAPLFNKFTLLEDINLKGQINDLLARCGFNCSGIFVMDGSKRSSHGNAYFTGIGKAKRIVFFDTLLTKLTSAEIVAVLAHELGHFKKKHIIKQMMLSFVVMLLMVYLAKELMSSHSLFIALGVNDLSIANGLILAFSILSLVSFIFAPVFSYLSRKNEFEADSFASEVSSKDALVSGLIKLYKDNASTLTPDYIYVLFYYSHPPASVRIAHLSEQV